MAAARLDGREHRLAWERVVDLPLEAGPHVLETPVRYRGSTSALGTGRWEFTAAAGETVEVLARDGPLNHQPLQPERRAGSRPRRPADGAIGEAGGGEPARGRRRHDGSGL